MDEIKLLEENVGINLTALETLLLSKTVITVGGILEFLTINNLVRVEKVKANGELYPESEQIGVVLTQSSLDALQNIRKKIWQSGKSEFGEHIPTELEDIVQIYSEILESICSIFIQAYLGSE